MQPINDIPITQPELSLTKKNPSEEALTQEDFVASCMRQIMAKQGESQAEKLKFWRTVEGNQHFRTSSMVQKVIFALRDGFLSSTNQPSQSEAELKFKTAQPDPTIKNLRARLEAEHKEKPSESTGRALALVGLFSMVGDESVSNDQLYHLYCDLFPTYPFRKNEDLIEYVRTHLREVISRKIDLSDKDLTDLIKYASSFKTDISQNKTKYLIGQLLVLFPNFIPSLELIEMFQSLSVTQMILIQRFDKNPSDLHQLNQYDEQHLLRVLRVSTKKEVTDFCKIKLVKSSYLLHSHILCLLLSGLIKPSDIIKDESRAKKMGILVESYNAMDDASLKEYFKDIKGDFMLGIRRFLNENTDEVLERVLFLVSEGKLREQYLREPFGSFAFFAES